MNARIVYPILAPRGRPTAHETEAEYFTRLAAERHRAERDRRRSERRAGVRAFLGRGSRPHGKR